MHVKNLAQCLRGHQSVGACDQRASGKESLVFRGTRGHFLKREHRGFMGSLTSELGIEYYVEFGCVETGQEEVE